MPLLKNAPAPEVPFAAHTRLGKILAPVIGSERDKAIIETALALAEPFHAHIEFLFVHPDPRLAVPFTDEPLSPGIIDEIVALARQGVDTARKAARASVETATKAAHVDLVVRPKQSQAVTASLFEVAGDFAHSIASAALLSDLVVFGSLTPAEWPDIRQGFVELLLGTRRPILIAPGATGHFSRRIAVAWDGSMASARALSAALPLLERTAEIDILHIRAETQHVPSFRAVEDYLAIYGLSATPHVFEQGSRSTGQALLAAAAKTGAELLVMGAYGHSHLREMVLGGVSQHVAWHAALPVLLTH